MTTTPPEVTWPPQKQLSPAEERRYMRKLAELEAAYRRKGDPMVLWAAVMLAWGARQPNPDWAMAPLGKIVIGRRKGTAAERYNERMRHVRRYIVVRDLRCDGHTVDDALDAAVKLLPAARGTIERSYDKVNSSLKRCGHESEFFYLVDFVDRCAFDPRTLWIGLLNGLDEQPAR